MRQFTFNIALAGTWEINNGQLTIKIADKTTTMTNTNYSHDKMKFVVKTN